MRVAATMPALFTSTSMPPSASCARAIAASQDAPLDTSQCSVTGPPPWAAGVIVRIVAVQHGHRRAMLDEEPDDRRADATGLAPP